MINKYTQRMKAKDNIFCHLVTWWRVFPKLGGRRSRKSPLLIPLGEWFSAHKPSYAAGEGRGWVSCSGTLWKGTAGVWTTNPKVTGAPSLFSTPRTPPLPPKTYCSRPRHRAQCVVCRKILPAGDLNQCSMFPCPPGGLELPPTGRHRKDITCIRLFTWFGHQHHPIEPWSLHSKPLYCFLSHPPWLSTGPKCWIVLWPWHFPLGTSCLPCVYCEPKVTGKNHKIWYRIGT